MEAPLAERIRPQRLEDYISQLHLVGENGSLTQQIARGIIPSMIFWGSPGTGKTTLAQIIARQSNRPFYEISAINSGVAAIREVIEKAKLSGGLFTAKNPILFIDEIHRLSRAVEEYLYPAMEDRKVDIMIGQGPAARSVRMEVPSFTVVGATTRQGLLTGPLRDRFGFTAHLDFYQESELERVLVRSANLLGVTIDSKAVSEITHLSGIVSYPGDETLLVQCPDDNRIEEANTQTKKLTSFLKNYVTQKQRFHRLSKILEDDLASVANTLGNMKDCSKTLLALEIQFDENFGGVNSKWTELYENLSSNLIFWSQTLK